MPPLVISRYNKRNVPYKVQIQCKIKLQPRCSMYFSHFLRRETIIRRKSCEALTRATAKCQKSKKDNNDRTLFEHLPNFNKIIKYSPAESEGPWKGSRIIFARLLGGSSTWWSAMALFTKRKPSWIFRPADSNNTFMSYIFKK